VTANSGGAVGTLQPVEVDMGGRTTSYPPAGPVGAGGPAGTGHQPGWPDAQPRRKRRFWFFGRR
jgi:hypothetical protein